MSIESHKTWGYSAKMSPRSVLMGFVVLCCAVPSWAQLPKRLERCLPNPSLAQEIEDMKQPAPKVYVRVLRVEFEPDSKIPQEIQNEIVKNEAGQTHEEDADSDYLKDVAAEVTEISVRGSMQRAGYFRVLVDGKATVLKKKGPDIDVSVAVTAEPGDQYRIGEINFKGADPDEVLAYSPETLRALFPLNRGDLLNVDAIRKGLRDLTNLYGRDGYIDMTAEPEFAINDETKIIDLTLRVDAQKQYRIRQIEFLGVNPQIESQLRQSYQQSGEVFDRSRMDKFFKDNQAILPVDFAPDQDVSIHRDATAGILDLIFDLRKCPGAGI